MSPISAQDKLQQLAEENEGRSWADYGVCATQHASLSPFVASYTYSVGCIKEQEAKLIARAYPTIMTQLYFEFCGGLSEVKDPNGSFAFGPKRPTAQTNTISKRTYVKQGLGHWFDIYQLASERLNRPIKNLKVDLYPNTLYQLFQLSPQELINEDLQLADLIGATRASLMLEEMEAAVSGAELVAIAERYFVEQLDRSEVLSFGGQGFESYRQTAPQLPTLNDSLNHQAQRHSKSERWLQKRYREVYGMSFKQMQSNLRFQQAHQALSLALHRRQPMSLTELALQCGYFDQAHFIKDFKRYTGMTPGQYLRSHTDQASQYLFYW